MLTTTVPHRPERAPVAAPASSWALAEPTSRPGLRSFLAAAAGVVAITTLGLVGFDYKPDLAMLYLVAIMLAALVGRSLALLAVSLAVLTFNFFFMAPRFALGIKDVHQLATVGIMVGAGLAISALTTRLRLKERDARDRERRTAALLAFTRDVVAAADVPEIADAAVRHVADILGAAAAVLVPADGQLVRAAGDAPLTARASDVARWSFEHGLPAGHGTTMLSDAHMTAIPLHAGDEVLGVLVLGGAPGVAVEQRHTIDALARQAGFAIGRVHLAASARAATLRARTEELRSSLLSAVSHDLRTPLAVITGAATSLRDDIGRADPDARAELLETIVQEARRLERVLQNLLNITRVETGLQPTREWVPVEELCGAALDRLADVLGSRAVTVEIAADLLVAVDPVLFEQVLINLVENAIKHGAPPLHIAARHVADHVELTVRDHGAGPPPGCETRVFDKFFRAPGSRAPGVGLGLAVCRGIVEAHGGTITAGTAPGGGALFCVRLPAAAPPNHPLPAAMEAM